MRWVNFQLQGWVNLTLQITSTNNLNIFTFKQAAHDVFALLDELNINQIDAIGFSGGGCVLLHMATLQPNRLKSLA
jgi:pimeloyl-ACP methyl ester carboxylesterase